MTFEPSSLYEFPADQQPTWPASKEIHRVREQLSVLPPLIEAEDVSVLQGHLARVAAGQVQVVQAGDCAEDWAECTPGAVARKAGLLDILAGVIRMTTHKPVLRVGRIAGQFGKPRSKPFETVGGVELPVYRGHMVNDPEPAPELRKPNPQRLLTGYWAARSAIQHLGWLGAGVARPDAPVWTSHEALLLDYEIPMVRRRTDGRLMLTSTHWPWIGERTRSLEGAHVNLLANVMNPVSCKVGPTMTVEQITGLCERLDPDREPGRLTLISRMGVDNVEQRLPALVRAVRDAGHPVIWLTDPMHGNTLNSPDGLKTRLVDSIIREMTSFQDVVSANGGVAGGLHLETTPDEVTECAHNQMRIHEVGTKYTSLCDPRLNPGQAISVVSAWRG